jgi:hypothetical protein
MNLKVGRREGLWKISAAPAEHRNFWPGASRCLGVPVNLLDDQTILTIRDTLNAELDLT